MKELTPHIAIVGGGTAGITVAARLRKALPEASILILDPAQQHYYQPLWTLVGAGVVKKEITARPEASVIPPGVDWLPEAVATFEPEARTLTTADGTRVRYDWLVVCPGIQINWDAIPGLRAALGKNGVCSNYTYDTADYTWQALRELRSGNAIFTMPATAVKCGGAPQKIMYLAEDYVRREGRREQVNIIYAAAGASIFGVEKYRKTLERIVRERGIQTRFRHHLVEVRGEQREAVFENLDTKERVTLPFAMLHAVPPMSAPDFIKASPLADTDGWCAADKFTLQHPRYPEVFALGDASSLPTSRTGAAIRKQAPVLVRNLLAQRAGQPLPARYDGYTSCPLVTRYGRMVLAEFDYDNQPAETFPFDQSKERYSMWLLKRYVLPQLYWHGMLKGRA